MHSSIRKKHSSKSLRAEGVEKLTGREERSEEGNERRSGGRKRGRIRRKKVHFVETKKGTRERSEKEEETVDNRR